MSASGALSSPSFVPIPSTGVGAAVAGYGNVPAPSGLGSQVASLSDVKFVGADKILPELRQKVQRSLELNMTTTAAFLADKVVTMSDGATGDVLVLAQVHYRMGQYARAVAALKRFGTVSSSPQGALLAGQCLAALKEWDLALETVGEDSGLAPDSFAKDEASLLCLLRGKIYDALENNPRAVQWLRMALEYDKYCYEAFQMLTENHMLNCEQENQVLADMTFSSNDTWLQAVYTSSTKQYRHRTDVLDELSTADEDVLYLKKDLSILVNSAAHHFACQRFEKALHLSKKILAQDPFRREALPVHICCLVELRHTSDLFRLAHQLSDEHPDASISLFAIASYYYLVQKYDLARRYFGRATSADVRFAPAWIGFGHSFAAVDETDQAMTAYRTASRLFSGLHEPLLYTGMEYLRTHNIVLAEQWFRLACRACPTDPLVYNELGVLAYENGQYAKARSLFAEALRLVGPQGLSQVWEGTLSNMGHVLRKLKAYDDAISYYEQALGVSPSSAQVLTSIGFTYHLQGRFEPAIDFYHKALGIHADDVFTTEMLSRALSEFFTGQM